MKNTIYFRIAIVFCITAISCSDQRSADRVLNDAQQRDDVLTEIANDSSLLAKLHQKMRDGDMRMNGGSSMMRSCMTMMDDPEMMNMMMDHMTMMR
jgi:hypothetical protein